MASRWFGKIAILSVLLLIDPVFINMICHETKLPRDCESLCSKDQWGFVSCELRAAVLLPNDTRFDISLQHVLLVLELALTKVRAQKLLPNWLEIKFLPKDDHCDAYLIRSFFTPDKCPTLAGKPKLFFIQACQFNRLDDGTVLKDCTETNRQPSTPAFRIQSHADFLIAHSTIHGVIIMKPCDFSLTFDVIKISLFVSSFIGHVDITLLPKCHLVHEEHYF